MSATSLGGRGEARALRGRRPTGIAGWCVLTVLLAFAIGPVIIFAFTSLKTQAEAAEHPLAPPTAPQWHNYVDAWRQAGLATGFVNSFVIVAGTVFGVLVVSWFAAYALARLRVAGEQAVVTYLLLIGALPMQLFLVPLFYLWTSLHLYDRQVGLILIYVALFSPFATLLLRSFMLTLPVELEEAARIDGAGELTIAARVVLPNVLPGVLTVALVTAISAYNEFLFAVTFLQSSELMPVSTTFFAFQQGYTQNAVLIAAAGVLMLLPLLILFMALQRKFIEGFAASGLST